MKTEIKKNGDTIVVSMNGKLDFETTIPLREDLGKILRQTQGDSAAKKIIFSFENLEFVGSSGISSFVQTLKDFNASSPLKPRFCHVGSEFRRVIKAFDEEQLFDFYENEERARRSFDQNN
jgi:anti-anti-sigma factor